MRREILADHKRRGTILVPPFTHMLGVLQEVSWVKTIIPEVCWIGLIQYDYGHQRGVELITSFTRTMRQVRSSSSREIFAATSSYSEIAGAEWAELRERMSATGDLPKLQQSLEPLIALYPQCPLGPVFAVPPTVAPENALERMRNLVASLFHRADRDPMMVQATAIWLAFDSGVLKVQRGLSLAQFPEIEHYPDTEISKRVGGAIRATLNGFFGQEQLYSRASSWPPYFWNRGLTLSPCELSND